jgi:hypothetical protein
MIDKCVFRRVAGQLWLIGVGLTVRARTKSRTSNPGR